MDLSVSPDARPALNRVLVVGLIDAALLLVLLYVAWVNHDESAVSILGPIHGFGFLALLFLTVRGAGEKLWGWWFPVAVLVTGGPLGSLVGDVLLRRQLPK